MGGGEIFRNSTDAIVVSPQDEAALVEGLQQLAGAADLRDRMSVATRQQPEEFTREKMASRRAGLTGERWNARPAKS
ncbi:MAG: hypothetical protein MUE44_08865 [Oscillatoriaceae cyanobacterium Prado104]|jgi:hypothetical protein|nr:hypothetical protein [Oscillatoriaceae cyanobacterium Prado104]